MTPRILYIFTVGRRERLESGGPTPKEFFYGFSRLQDAHPETRFIEENDFGRGAAQKLPRRAVERAFLDLTGLSLDSLLRYFFNRDFREALDQSDVIVATSNYQGLSLAALKMAGKLRQPVLLLAMGVMPKRAIHKWVFRVLLKRIRLAPISKSEAQALARDFDGADYVPFGIDADFWTPSEDEDGDYVFSIGNDFRRDYQTLARAWRPGMPKLKVVTRLDVPPSEGPVETITGDWRRQVLSDEDIRSLYRKARFVVLPIIKTMQPSGQSACLQAMACGKAVILSDIDGLWDRDVMVDGETCLLVPVSDANALRDAAERLVADPALAAEIGMRARRAVESHFNLDVMDQALESRIADILKG